MNFDFRNTNSLWCGVLAETLCRCGVRQAVVSPGSRSAPLVFALANHPEIEAIPVLDERSAAFFALGLAKQNQGLRARPAHARPVALVCTSGTAAANFFPAIIEAQESGVPLVVITADRPPEMRECASGQTIDQQKLYGSHVNWYHELAVPEASLGRLRYLRQTVAHACARAMEPERGPVHLNAPFRDPLAPLEDGSVRAEDWRGKLGEEFFGHLGDGTQSVVARAASPCADAPASLRSGTGCQPVSEEHGLAAHATAQSHGQAARATHGLAAHATPRTGAPLQIRQGAYLPHWTRDGATYAVTFRLADALPQAVLQAWLAEREDIVVTAKQLGRPLSAHELERLDFLHSEKIEDYLDSGAGECLLRRDEIAGALRETFEHFDGNRYHLHAWCVMPNHAHVIVQPRPGFALEKIVHTWKSYTATKANRLLGRQGAFWQPEYYDHLIRGEADYLHSAKYINDNPAKAGLKNWKWLGSGSGSGTGCQPVSEEHGLAAQATAQSHGQAARATDGLPAHATDQAHGQAAHATAQSHGQAARATARAIIVAGPGATAGAIAQLAAQTGWPVLADALSEARHTQLPAGCVCVSTYDAILRNTKLASELAPDFVLCAGDGWPTSKTLRAWLEKHDPEILMVSPAARNRDALHGRARWLASGSGMGDPPMLDRVARATRPCSVSSQTKYTGESPVPPNPMGESPMPLNPTGESPVSPNPHGRVAHATQSTHPTEPARATAYRAAWQRAETAARATLDNTFAAIDGADFFEPRAAWLLAKHLPEHTPVFVASSMPVRDAECFWPASNRAYQFYFNRGANGIDGTLSTALGVAHGNERPAVLLTGDLSLLHDTNGFLLAAQAPVARAASPCLKNMGRQPVSSGKPTGRPPVPPAGRPPVPPRFRGSLTIVLINNNGGGIFEHLPVAQFEPPFEEFFATPQNVDFAKLCAAHGVRHTLVKNWGQFAKLVSALPARGVRVLEIRADRKRDAARRAALLARAAAKIK